MQWEELKARLLEAGSARLSGEPADDFIAKSTAGPGAGGKGAVFFAMGNHRVKLVINPASPVEIAHRGGGVADLYFEDRADPWQTPPAGASLPGPGFHHRYGRLHLLLPLLHRSAASR